MRKSIILSGFFLILLAGSVAKKAIKTTSSGARIREAETTTPNNMGNSASTEDETEIGTTTAPSTHEVTEPVTTRTAVAEIFTETSSLLTDSSVQWTATTARSVLTSTRQTNITEGNTETTIQSPGLTSNSTETITQQTISTETNTDDTPQSSTQNTTVRTTQTPNTSESIIETTAQPPTLHPPDSTELAIETTTEVQAENATLQTLQQTSKNAIETSTPLPNPTENYRETTNSPHPTPAFSSNSVGITETIQQSIISIENDTNIMMTQTTLNYELTPHEPFPASTESLPDATIEHGVTNSVTTRTEILQTPTTVSLEDDQIATNFTSFTSVSPETTDNVVPTTTTERIQISTNVSLEDDQIATNFTPFTSASPETTDNVVPTTTTERMQISTNVSSEDIQIATNFTSFTSASPETTDNIVPTTTTERMQISTKVSSEDIQIATNFTSFTSASPETTDDVVPTTTTERMQISTNVSSEDIQTATNFTSFPSASPETTDDVVPTTTTERMQISTNVSPEDIHIAINFTSFPSASPETTDNVVAVATSSEASQSTPLPTPNIPALTTQLNVNDGSTSLREKTLEGKVNSLEGTVLNLTIGVAVLSFLVIVLVIGIFVYRMFWSRRRGKAPSFILDDARLDKQGSRDAHFRPQSDYDVLYSGRDSGVSQIIGTENDRTYSMATFDFRSPFLSNAAKEKYDNPYGEPAGNGTHQSGRNGPNFRHHELETSKRRAPIRISTPRIVDYHDYAVPHMEMKEINDGEGGIDNAGFDEQEKIDVIEKRDGVNEKTDAMENQARDQPFDDIRLDE